jgi:biotin carboxyl carrier protein
LEGPLLGAWLEDKNRWVVEVNNNRCMVVRSDIAVDGKSYRVEVDGCKIGAPFSVKVNDKPVEVNLDEEPNCKRPFTIKVHGKLYTVELAKIVRQEPFSVRVNNAIIKVELKSAREKTIAMHPLFSSVLIQAPTKKIVGGGVVTAPMAGKIISVKVKRGDSVKEGDVLCTLEAMKMENEVTAPKNGIVEEITIQEGKTVNADDILVVIK